MFTFYNMFQLNYVLYWNSWLIIEGKSLIKTEEQSNIFKPVFSYNEGKIMMKGQNHTLCDEGVETPKLQQRLLKFSGKHLIRAVPC